MKISRFALLGMALVAMAGCRDDSTDPVTPVIPDLAYIRYINAVPDTMNTTFRFIDQIQYVPLTWVNVPYRGLGSGNYQGVRLDAHKVRVFNADVSDFNAAGNTAILIDTTLTFEKGKYYTILHTGYARTGSTPRQRLQVIEDALPAQSASVSVRFINTGANLAALDIYNLATATTPVAGAPALAALAPGAVSAYLTRATGQFSSVATTVGSTTALLSGVAPAGVAGNPRVPASNGIAAIDAVDPVGGATVAGSVMTAIAFPAAVPGSRAAAAAAPSIVFFVDRQPPRFSTP